MKKITNVTNVMMMKSRIAQRIRLIRYRTISSPPGSGSYLSGSP
jgi:hypothetical protein